MKEAHLLELKKYFAPPVYVLDAAVRLKKNLGVPYHNRVRDISEISGYIESWGLTSEE